MVCQCLTRIGFSRWPSGRIRGRVVTTCLDGNARVWDLATRTATATFSVRVAAPGSNDVRLPVAVSPNGARVLVGSWPTGASVYEAESGKLVGALRSDPPDPRPGVEAVAFLPNGDLLTINNATRGRVWNHTTLLPSGSAFETSVNGVRTIATAASPDGKYVAAGQLAEKSVNLIALDRGKLVARGPHSERITATAFSPDSRLMASGSEDTNVRIWKVPELTPWCAPLRPWQ